MKSTKTAKSPQTSRSLRPALTPEAREGQLISLAVDLAEQQLRDGTASAQVITHYLKLGSTRERLERELLETQNRLAAAKAEAIASQEHIEELYTNAMEAMRRYSGHARDDYENPAY